MSKPIRRPIAGPKRALAGSSQVRKPLAGSRAGTNARQADEGYLYVAGVRDASQRVSEYRAESDVCPVCHTDRQFNKNLRLLVSPCYHKIANMPRCESCIDRLFTLGPEPCPQCGRVLRKVNFAHQTFEDLKVEKEVSVRRRMAEFFNKRRDDFKSDREHDDYLEEVEDMTFNLLNDIDIPKTEARIAQFQKQNAGIIASNKQNALLEAMGQQERDDLEKRARQERMEMVANAERMDREQEERAKGQIGEALMRGDQIRAKEIRDKADREKTARAEALARAVPASLTNLMPATEEDHPDPLSAEYNGPYVPFPYSDPEEATWTKWYTLKEDYVDGREGVWTVKEDKEGKVRGGGFELGLFWEMEIRSAVEGLGIEPLR